MIDFTNAKLGKLAVHKIGNKNEDEGIVFSDDLIKLQGGMIEELLLKFFLSSFTNDIFYNFHHENNLSFNEVYSYSNQIFDDSELFFERSKDIVKHLYENSLHPKIKGGEFYAVIIKDCMIEDEIANAVGFFKTENKDTYLKVEEEDKNFKIGYETGININKLDKGCLILNTEKENGYIVKIVDNINKSKEAQYWKDDFLKIKIREDKYYFTNTYLNMCKTFAEKGLEDLEKKDRIALKNDVLQYFDEKESFDLDGFKDEVIANEGVAKTFMDFKQNYEIEKEINLSDDFEISPNAVKDNKRKFRSVIKLDKNFHIYIHGNQNLVEKDYDEKFGKKYYKLYFDKEN